MAEFLFYVRHGLPDIQSSPGCDLAPGARFCRQQTAAVRDPMSCYRVEETLKLPHAADHISRSLVTHGARRVRFFSWPVSIYTQALLRGRGRVHELGRRW